MNSAMRISPLIAALILSCHSGCDRTDAWKARTFPASGTISINGEPPKGAVILLISRGNPPDRRKSQPYAIVQDDGTYHLGTYQPEDGAPAGEYAVTLFWQTTPGSPIADDRLDGAFRTIEKSPANVTIKSGTTQIPHISLSNAKILRTPRSPEQSIPISSENSRPQTTRKGK